MSAEAPTDKKIEEKPAEPKASSSDSVLLVLSPQIKELQKVIDRCSKEENIHNEVVSKYEEVIKKTKEYSHVVMLCSVQNKDDIMKIMNILKPLRALVYSKKVFPIAVSTIKNPKLQDALMKSGVRDYLNFPVSLQTLFFKLRVQFRAHKKAKQGEELTLKRKTVKQKEGTVAALEEEEKANSSSTHGNTQGKSASSDKDMKLKHLKKEKSEEEEQGLWRVKNKNAKTEGPHAKVEEASEPTEESDDGVLEERESVYATSNEAQSFKNDKKKVTEFNGKFEKEKQGGGEVEDKRGKSPEAREIQDQRTKDAAEARELNDQRTKDNSKPRDINDQRTKDAGSPREIQDRRAEKADPVDVSRAVSSIGFALKLSDRMISNISTSKIFEEIFSDAQKKLDSVEFSVLYTPGYQQTSLVYLVYSNETASIHTQSAFTFGSVSDLYSCFQKQKMKVCKDWAKGKETVLIPLKHSTGVVGFLVTSSIPGSFDKIKLKTLTQLANSITDIVHFEGKSLITKSAA